MSAIASTLGNKSDGARPERVESLSGAGISALLCILDEDCRAAGVQWALVASPAVVEQLGGRCTDRAQHESMFPMARFGVCATWLTPSTAAVSWCYRYQHSLKTAVGRRRDPVVGRGCRWPRRPGSKFARWRRRFCVDASGGDDIPSWAQVPAFASSLRWSQWAVAGRLRCRMPLLKWQWEQHRPGVDIGMPGRGGQKSGCRRVVLLITPSPKRFRHSGEYGVRRMGGPNSGMGRIVGDFRSHRSSQPGQRHVRSGSEMAMIMFPARGASLLDEPSGTVAVRARSPRSLRQISPSAFVCDAGAEPKADRGRLAIR